MTRLRLSLVLEIALWVLVMGWLVFLVIDIGENLKQGTLPLRSAFEFLLLGLLAYWPMFRTRIRHGYWMESWDDDPAQR